METTLDTQNWQSEVLSSQVPILVDFWAEWCMPCRIIAPVLEEISKEYEGKVRIGKLNVDEFPDLATQYSVRSIPNMKLFKGGQVVDELVGAMPKAEIVKRLEKHF